jgi:TRAP-type mannitol/chloroaromatic compound transport system permease small subunit
MNHLFALSRQIDRISRTAAQLAVLLVLVCALISVERLITVCIRFELKRLVRDAVVSLCGHRYVGGCPFTLY